MTSPPSPQRRLPTAAFRVTWTRSTWQQFHTQPSRAWDSKWYVQRARAERLSTELANSGAFVRLDEFTLSHVSSTEHEPVDLTFLDDEDEPDLSWLDDEDEPTP